MGSYVYDAKLPYRLHLERGAGDVSPDVELPSYVQSLLGAPIPPAGWPLPAAEPALPFDWNHADEWVLSPVFNAPLAELKSQAKSAEAMWALERFDVGREALRRGQHREACHHFKRSLEGDEHHAGNALDFRSHFLLGVVYLGSYRLTDPDVLDLAKAETAFLAAAQHTPPDRPRETALAHCAAGWACYCAGRMEEALDHSQRAVAIDATWSPAQFQTARILLHRREPDLARSYLGQAIALDPGCVALTLSDAEFAPYSAVVLELIALEREQVGRRASDALKELIDLSAALKLEASDDPETAATAEAIERLNTAARSVFRTNSLHGYLQAEAAVAAAMQLVQAFARRLEHEKHTAVETIEAARKKLAHIAELKIGAYHLGATSRHQLEQAQASLQQAEACLLQPSLASYLDTQRRALGVLALLDHTAEAFRDSALHHATTACAALEAELARLHQRNSSGHRSAKAFALIGALVALFPGGFIGLFTLRLHGNLADTMMRVCLFVGAFAVVGAVLGALLLPVFQPDLTLEGRQLEERRTALQQTISELRALALAKGT